MRMRPATGTSPSPQNARLVNADEVPLELLHRVVGEPQVRFARTSVEEEEERIRDIVAPDQHPLRIAIQLDLLQFGDAVGRSNRSREGSAES